MSSEGGVIRKLEQFYLKHYKVWLVLTLLLIPASFGILAYNKSQTGEYITKGVSLKGGITVTIPVQEQVDINALQTSLDSRHPDADITVRGISEFGRQTGIIIEAADVETDPLLESMHESGLNFEPNEVSVEEMGSALGASFFRQVMTAVILSFIFMAIVVFIVFRNPATSFFVVLAAFSDILGTLAVTTLLEIKLSTAGIAAFLMLIGYSVDTDILLTTRVTKRKEGTVEERTLRALKTGLIMSATSLAAVTAALFITQSETIRQIMLILFIGLLFDMVNTWLQNASILRLYLEWKAKKKRQKHGGHHG